VAPPPGPHRRPWSAPRALRLGDPEDGDDHFHGPQLLKGPVGGGLWLVELVLQSPGRVSPIKTQVGEELARKFLDLDVPRAQSVYELNVSPSRSRWSYQKNG
jgi:hypothetical protein